MIHQFYSFCLNLFFWLKIKDLFYTLFLTHSFFHKRLVVPVYESSRAAIRLSHRKIENHCNLIPVKLAFLINSIKSEFWGVSGRSSGVIASTDFSLSPLTINMYTYVARVGMPGPSWRIDALSSFTFK